MSLQIRKTEHLDIACPFCGQQWFEIGHLKVGTQFGPWFCDECGRSFLGTIGISSVEWMPGTERLVPTKVTLEIRTEDAPITFLVDSFLIVEQGETPEESPGMENAQYFYEEHTCPTNWLMKVEEVIDKNGRHDPHGVFKYVKTEILK